MKRTFILSLLLLIFYSVNAQKTCDASLVPVTLTINSSYLANEVSWQIRDLSQNVVFERDYGYESNTAVRDSFCLVKDQTYRFVTSDTEGDGWNGTTYELSCYNKTLIANNNGESPKYTGSISSSEQFTVSCNEVCFNYKIKTTNTSFPNSQDGIICIITNTNIDQTYYWTGPNGFTSQEDTITDLAPGKYNLTINTNSCQYTDIALISAGKCKKGTSPATLSIDAGGFEFYSTEMMWQLKDNSGDVVDQVKPNTLTYGVNEYELCLVENATYKFVTINTSGGFNYWGGSKYELYCREGELLANNNGLSPQGKYSTASEETFAANCVNDCMDYSLAWKKPTNFYSTDGWAAIKLDSINAQQTISWTDEQGDEIGTEDTLWVVPLGKYFVTVTVNNCTIYDSVEVDCNSCKENQTFLYSSISPGPQGGSQDIKLVVKNLQGVVLLETAYGSIASSSGKYSWGQCYNNGETYIVEAWNRYGFDWRNHRYAIECLDESVIVNNNNQAPNNGIPSTDPWRGDNPQLESSEQFVVDCKVTSGYDIVVLGARTEQVNCTGDSAKFSVLMTNIGPDAVNKLFTRIYSVNYGDYEEQLDNNISLATFDTLRYFLGSYYPISLTENHLEYVFSADNQSSFTNDIFANNNYFHTYINTPEKLEIFIDSTINPQCGLESDGAIFLNTNKLNYHQPITVKWADSESTSLTRNNLEADSYIVTITTNNGCLVDKTIEITAPEKLTNNLLLTDDLTGQCNGSALAQVNGGIAPYSYLWDDMFAQTTDLAENLCIGNYNITITDSIGCQLIKNFDIEFKECAEEDQRIVFINFTTTNNANELVIDIKDDSLTSVFDSYQNTLPNNKQINYYTCLTKDKAYTLEAIDRAGDGWNGATYAVTCEYGNVIINNNNQSPDNGINTNSTSTETIEGFVVSCFGVSIDENVSSNQELLIFPNPVNKFLNIQFIAEKSINYNLSIFDVFGKLIYQNKNTNGNDHSLDMSHFAQGIYYLRLEQNGLLLKQEKIIKY
jgi:hypothetical protein